MTPVTSSDIQSTLNEQRVFDPPSDFSSKAHIRSMAEYNALCEAARNDPESFWARIGGEIDWFEPWTKVLDWSARRPSGSSTEK